MRMKDRRADTERITAEYTVHHAIKSTAAKNNTN